MGKKLTPEQIAGYERDGFICPVDAFSGEQAYAWKDKLEAFERAEGQKMTRGHNFKPHLLFPWVDEIVHSADSSIVALLGASPGASTAVWIMVHMLENCFHKQLVGHWVPKLKEMIPSYGHDLKTDAALTERVRRDTAEVLGLHTV